MESYVVGFVFFIFVSVFTAFLLRRVVPTNEVHIVQSRKATKSYGKDTKNGNTYYEWPAWLPIVGVTKIVMPVSVFDVQLVAYEAYDVGRVPFVVDIVAFFRIADSNLAAQRVESFRELESQLTSIVQGAVRTILASHDIDKIMLERSVYGEQFTDAVTDQLTSWGVVPVKNIELMDIRDAVDNRVVHNIMEKKKSLIEMQSRVEVADNIKNAEIAEIDAHRERDIRDQQAKQAVGERTAEKDKAVGIANEIAAQDIKEQQRLTKEKEMAVIQVNDVKRSEITREMNVVKAHEDKDVMILRADGDKQSTVLRADGDLEAKKREAEGITVEGIARADAERAMQLAPVEAQIVLAKEIGSNDGYQNYLISIRAIEANQVVGTEQAQALKVADLKVIANAGDAPSGVNKVMDIFSSKGGTELAGMVEAFAQSEQGQAVMKKFGVTTDAVKSPPKKKPKPKPEVFE
ncbi:MAG: SPFH domain-containing protein [Alphaproteobacteria bacterium]